MGKMGLNGNECVTPHNHTQRDKVESGWHGKGYGELG